MSLAESQFAIFRKRFWPRSLNRMGGCLSTGNGPQGDAMSLAPALSQSLLDEFDRRVMAVAVSLKQRQQTVLPDPRCDLLLATYVLGLTTPFYENSAPDQHLGAIRNRLAHVMPSERVTQALLATPPDGDDWYTNALEPIEAIGRKDGREFFVRYAGADGTASIRN